VLISASSRSCSGHAKLDNTAFYTKVATRTVRTVTSPLDKLGMFKAGEIAPTG
jgi:integrase/recombinase XerD